MLSLHIDLEVSSIEEGREIFNYIVERIATAKANTVHFNNGDELITPTAQEVKGKLLNLALSPRNNELIPVNENGHMSQSKLIVPV